MKLVSDTMYLWLEDNKHRLSRGCDECIAKTAAKEMSHGPEPELSDEEATVELARLKRMVATARRIMRLMAMRHGDSCVIQAAEPSGYYIPRR
jgi:hypothetical protein